MPITLGNTTITGLGVGGLPSGTVNATTLANAAVTRVKMGYAGAILQVVQTVKSDTFSGVSNTAALSVTGLSATITPTSTSSKIWIVGHIMYGCNETTYGGWFRRGSTDIGLGDGAGSRQRVSMGMALSSDSNQSNTFVYSFLDSPGSTSALTYQFFVVNDNAQTFFLNRSVSDGDAAVGKRGISTVTLLEVSG